MLKGGGAFKDNNKKQGGKHICYACQVNKNGAPATFYLNYHNEPCNVLCAFRLLLKAYNQIYIVILSRSFRPLHWKNLEKQVKMTFFKFLQMWPLPPLASTLAKTTFCDPVPVPVLEA
jgi:hypothetical protein